MNKKYGKKAIAIILSLAMVISLFTVSDLKVASAATKSVGLKTTSKTLSVGKSFKLKLKNNTLGWKVKKAVSNNSKICKAVNKKTYVNLKAQKAGNAKIVVTLSRTNKKGNAKIKKLTCKVKVKAVKKPTPTKNTPTETPVETPTEAPTPTNAPAETPAPLPTTAAETETSKTVSTQNELELALKQPSLTSITLKTDAAEKFIVPEGSYKNVDFTVDAPKADVTNSGQFKSITIRAIKQDTYEELTSGNIITVEAAVSRIIVAVKAVVEKIIFAQPKADAKLQVRGTVNEVGFNAGGVNAQVAAEAGSSVGKVSLPAQADSAKVTMDIKGKVDNVDVNAPKADVKFIVDGTIGDVALGAEKATVSMEVNNAGKVNNVTVSKDTNVNVSGTTTAAIPMKLSDNATLTTSIAVTVESSGNNTVSLNQGAEKSSVKITSNSANVKVDNHANETIQVTKTDGTAVNVSANGGSQTVQSTSTSTSSGSSSSSGNYNYNYIPSGGNSSSSATATPTVAPTVVPTVAPTVAPTNAPTVKPTAAPTAKPTAAPTASPTPEPTYSIAVSTDTPANGTVSSDKANAKAGDTVTLTVTANPFYKVNTVTIKYNDKEENINKDANTEKYTFTMPAADVTVTATFEQKDIFDTTQQIKASDLKNQVQEFMKVFYNNAEQTGELRNLLTNTNPIKSAEGTEQSKDDREKGFNNNWWCTIPFSSELTPTEINSLNNATFKYGNDTLSKDELTVSVGNSNYVKGADYKIDNDKSNFKISCAYIATAKKDKIENNTATMNFTIELETQDTEPKNINAAITIREFNGELSVTATNPIQSNNSFELSNTDSSYTLTIHNLGTAYDSNHRILMTVKGNEEKDNIVYITKKKYYEPNDNDNSIPNSDISYGFTNIDVKDENEGDKFYYYLPLQSNNKNNYKKLDYCISTIDCKKSAQLYFSIDNQADKTDNKEDSGNSGGSGTDTK